MTIKRLISVHIIILILLATSCKKDDPAPSNTSSTTNSTNGGTTTTAATVTAPNTYFLSNGCYSMNKLGDWWVNGFTLNATTNLVLRFSSRYAADAAIVTDAQLDNFKNNKTFTGYAVFDDKFGYTTVTLPAGNYTLGVRNQISGANTMTIELDYAITLPSTDRATFNDYYINGVQTLNAGAKLWHPFTIEKGVRYFIDGNNTGLDCYVIPASELDNFKNNLSFKYYTDYSGTDCANPGLIEYKLPLGDYVLAFRNSQSIPNTVEYLMERWVVK